MIILLFSAALQLATGSPVPGENHFFSQYNGESDESAQFSPNSMLPADGIDRDGRFGSTMIQKVASFLLQSPNPTEVRDLNSIPYAEPSSMSIRSLDTEPTSPTSKHTDTHQSDEIDVVEPEEPEVLDEEKLALEQLENHDPSSETISEPPEAKSDPAKSTAPEQTDQSKTNDTTPPNEENPEDPASETSPDPEESAATEPPNLTKDDKLGTNKTKSPNENNLERNKSNELADNKNGKQQPEEMVDRIPSNSDEHEQDEANEKPKKQPDPKTETETPQQVPDTEFQPILEQKNKAKPDTTNTANKEIPTDGNENDKEPTVPGSPAARKEENTDLLTESDPDKEVGDNDNHDSDDEKLELQPGIPKEPNQKAEIKNPDKPAATNNQTNPKDKAEGQESQPDPQKTPDKGDEKTAGPPTNPVDQIEPKQSKANQKKPSNKGNSKAADTPTNPANETEQKPSTADQKKTPDQGRETEPEGTQPPNTEDKKVSDPGGNDNPEIAEESNPDDLGQTDADEGLRDPEEETPADNPSQISETPNKPGTTTGKPNPKKKNGDKQNEPKTSPTNVPTNKSPSTKKPIKTNNNKEKPASVPTEENEDGNSDNDQDEVPNPDDAEEVPDAPISAKPARSKPANKKPSQPQEIAKPASRPSQPQKMAQPAKPVVPNKSTGPARSRTRPSLASQKPVVAPKSRIHKQAVPDPDDEDELPAVEFGNKRFSFEIPPDFMDVIELIMNSRPFLNFDDTLAIPLRRILVFLSKDLHLFQLPPIEIYPPMLRRPSRRELIRRQSVVVDLDEEELPAITFRNKRFYFKTPLDFMDWIALIINSVPFHDCDNTLAIPLERLIMFMSVDLHLFPLPVIKSCRMIMSRRPTRRELLGLNPPSLLSRVRVDRQRYKNSRGSAFNYDYKDDDENPWQNVFNFSNDDDEK